MVLHAIREIDQSPQSDKSQLLLETGTTLTVCPPLNQAGIVRGCMNYLMLIDKISIIFLRQKAKSAVLEVENRLF